MAKHSKDRIRSILRIVYGRSRRRIHQSGLGGGFAVVHRLPKTVRRLPDAPCLGVADEFRLRCVEHARRAGVADAVTVFGRSRATIYRWLRRYDPDDLRSLRPHSRRPNRTRRHQWTAAQEQAVARLREQYPRYGKQKLWWLLRAADVVLSASMIGRILSSLRRRGLLIEPRPARVRPRQSARPYATRVPKDTRKPEKPGALIQLDTMHLRPLPGVERRQFTAIDVVTRCAVLGVRSQATAGTATAFLDELVDRMPVPVQAILTRWRLRVHGRVRTGLPGA